MNRGHGWLDEPMTVELNRQEYIAKQHRDVRQAAFRRFMAEDRVAVKQHMEILALRRAILSPEPDPEIAVHRRAEDTLAVARAAQETLLAKRNLARERRNEAKLQMQVSQDEEEDLNDRIKVALRQVGTLIREMNIRGIYSTSPADFDEDDGYEEPGIAPPAPFSMQLHHVTHGRSTWVATTSKSATGSIPISLRGSDGVETDGDDNTTELCGESEGD